MNKLNKFSGKAGFVAALMLTTAIVPICAYAEEQPANETTPSAANNNSGQEIVITAQRRRENVQNVNIAVTALSGDSLSEKKVMRAIDLQTVAPGLTISRSGVTDSFNIRGIGLASGSPQVTNGVATYIDGVFQPPIVSNGQFYDMAGAEVLRGPQGTLSGANSTGGAVYLSTRRPQLDVFGGYISGNYGNFNNIGVNGAVNVPLGENLAIRIAGLSNSHDAWFNDIGPANNNPESLIELDGRVQVLFAVGGFQANVKFERVDRKHGGYAVQPISTTATNNPYVVGRTGRPWEVSYDSPVANRERASAKVLELKYEFDGGMTLRLNSAYQNKRLATLTETDGTSLNRSNSTLNQTAGANNVRERVLSHEINLISPNDGRLKYVLGAYFQRNKIDLRNWSTTNGAFTTLPHPVTSKTLQGVFGQLTYQLNDEFSIDFGLRHSKFEVNGSGAVYRAAAGSTLAQVLVSPPIGATVLVPQTGSESDSQTTGKLALNFKPDANNLYYIFASSGYKNGGINPPGGTFRPETVWDYEAGWKSTMFDNHLRTQIGVFYMNYEDFQMDVVNPLSGQGGVINLTNSTIKGFEASFQAKLDGLSIDGGLSYVDSSVGALSLINKWSIPAGVTLPQCAAGVANGPTCFNYTYATSTGGPNLYSPKWTWNLSASYRFDLGNDMAVTPRVGYAFIDSQWAYPTYQVSTDLIESRGLLQAGVTFERGDLKIEGYATNLTDEFYVAGQTGKNELYGAPREYGLRISTKF